MYYSDDFQDPKPFAPSVVVGIDAAAEKKWQCISAMPSQFGDKDSWQGRTLPDVPATDRERQAYLLDIVKKRGRAVADLYRRAVDCVVRCGARQGDQVRGGVSAGAIRTPAVAGRIEGAVPHAVGQCVCASDRAR